MNVQKSEINLNQKLLTPEQLRDHFLNINKTFCNYIQSLNKDYEENPEYLNGTMKYSTELINEFSGFYQNFNNLFDKSLKESKNQNERNLQTKNILIDNKTTKCLSDILILNNNKLKKLNNETKEAISRYNEELNNILSPSKSK